MVCLARQPGTGRPQGLTRFPGNVECHKIPCNIPLSLQSGTGTKNTTKAECFEHQRDIEGGHLVIYGHLAREILV